MGTRSDNILNGEDTAIRLLANGEKDATTRLLSNGDKEPSIRLLSNEEINRSNPSNPHCKPTFKQSCPQILASFAALSIHVPVGVVIGFSAIFIPQLKKPDSDIPIDKTQEGLLASMPVLIVIPGAMLGGWLVEWLGRLTAIKLSTIPYVIGWVFMALTDNFTLLLFGRFLTGFVIAFGPSTSIVYVTEVANPDMRGALTSCGPALTSAGMLFVYAIGSYLHWRIIAWTCIIYALIPLIAMQVLSPESPQWLIAKGNKEKAAKSLTILHRYHPKDSIEVEEQLRSLVHDTTSTQTSHQSNNFLVFAKGMLKPTGYKPFCILFCMFSFQQLGGVYLTLFYAVQFFEDVGNTVDPYLAAVLIATIRLVVGFLTSGLIRKFGRRTLCMTSCILMSIFLAIAAYFTRQIHLSGAEGHVMWIVVGCLLCYMAVSCTGLLPIPWTLTAELFPLEIRGMAQGFTVGVAHMVMFGVTAIYPHLKTFLGGSHGVQFFFCVSSIVAIVFIYFFLPETNGKTLKEIEEYFEHNTVYPLRKKTQNNVQV